MTDYDRWKTSPPDEPECEPCGEKTRRIGELEDLLDWVLAHRFYWFAEPSSVAHSCALMPYTHGDTVCEGRTRGEAVEKLWREQP